MKHILMVFFFAAGICFAGLAQQPGNLDFLKSYKDKYAYQVKLFENATLKKRLQKMLGATQYSYLLKKVWQVETPIRIENDFLYAWAMQEHSGGDPSATLLADFHTNRLYVEIKKAGVVTTYAEDGTKTVPQPLSDWAKLQIAK